MSKLSKSERVLPSKLHFWGSLPTQTAIKEVKRTDFYPLSSLDSSDTVNFRIPKTPHQMLDRVEIYTEFRVLTADDRNPAANNNVSTVPDLSGALWRNVDVTIGGVSITQSFDNSYAMAHFFDTVVHTTSAMRHFMFEKEGLLLDHVSDKATSENTVYYPTEPNQTAANTSGLIRANRIARGQRVAIVSDLNVSLFKQEKLLLPDLDIDISLTKNDPGFILLSAGDKTERIKLDRVVLQCTFVKPDDLYLVALETRLLKSNASYHADKSVLTFQNIPAGSLNPTFDNLFQGDLPYFFYCAVQDRSAFGKDRTKNPYTFHKFTQINLTIDGDDYFPNPLKMIGDNHGIMYHEFLRSTGYINGGDTLIGAFYKPHQVMAFDLSQDKSQNQQGHLNLKRGGATRLSLTLPEPAAENQVLMILAYYERVIEITKDREVIVG